MAPVAAFSCFTAMVQAQEIERFSQLEEIVVTAQRREASLQDTPIAITAFNTDRLVDIGAFNISEVAEYVPNVIIGKTPSSNSNMGVAIRGLGTGDTALTLDPKVTIYIDGILISKTTSAVFDIAELERVEILRGPQGTLFGRNTIGGAINVATRRPTGKFDARVEASAGNYGYRRYGGRVNLPELKGLATSLAFNHMETDGWARNHYSGAAQPPQKPTEKVEKNLASQDNDAYRLALRWQAHEKLLFDYTYDKIDNSGVAPPFQIVKISDYLYNGFSKTPVNFELLGGDLYRQMAANVRPGNHRQRHFHLDEMTREYLKVEGHAFVGRWDVTDDLAIKYLYGKRRSRHNTGADLDGGVYFARDLFYGVYAGNNGPIQVPGFHARVDDGWLRMESHEIQIVGAALDERLRYTGGAFYYKERVYENNPQTFSLPISFITPQGVATPQLGPLYNAAGFCPPAFGGVCIGTQRLPIPGPNDPDVPGVIDFAYGQKTESQAFYGQATYSIAPRLDSTLGIRYTKDRKSAFLYNQNMIQSVPGHGRNNPVRGGDDWKNVSYLFNMQYSFTDSINTYASYSTGYNAGGFTARASTAAGFSAGYDPEKVKSAEIGVKSEWFSNTLRINMAVFRNDYTDMQITQVEGGSSGSATRTVNAGEALLKGVEVEFVAIPMDGLMIDGSYGYLDARFKEYLEWNPQSGRLENIASRTKVPRAPKNTATVGLQYDFGQLGKGRLSARMDITYKGGSSFHPYLNEWSSLSRHTLVNARLTLDEIPVGCCDGKSRMRVSLWGKNLGDEQYRQWGTDFGTMGFTGVVFGEPRTYGLDVIYTYD